MAPKGRKRFPIATALGLIWALAVLWLGRQLAVPIAMIQPVLMGAVFAPGLVLAAMIGRITLRRAFDPTLVEGQRPPPGTAADVDARALQNTIEQLALALCLWPLVGFSLGAGMVLALGLGFAAARLIFWIGYHRSAAVRMFGFWASFFPSVLAALWVLARLGSG
ncbi:MAG: MAPEG family protein [Pseudomonadota bacterium]